MKAFPMFFKTSGRTVAIVGGGEQAAQKARLILKTDARIRVVAAELDAELGGMVASGRANYWSGSAGIDAFSDAAMVFVATGCAGADAATHALAKEAGAIVNVVDRPDLCDITTPSIVDRDPVVVAIGTEGTAPVLARQIKTDIEGLLAPRIGTFAALAGHLRDAVAERIPAAKRRAFWAWAFKGEPARRHIDGDEAGAAALLKQAISLRAAPADAGRGHISLVGAGPGARDLLTMRAVQRLQEADIIFYDRLVDPDVLELARRDAERVFVGKEVGACAWPQEKICAVIAAEARKGRRVVRLKSGDPSIFGRAGEEIQAARAAGIGVEIVPGITAASAAAAAMERSLTERGATDSLVLVTGQCKPGDPDPDWAHHVRPGTTVAVYMGARAAGRIANNMIHAGAAGTTPVEIACSVSYESERLFSSDLNSLGNTMLDNEIKGSALILIRFPKRSQTALTIAAE